MQFHLNGVPRQFDGDPDLPLLTYLRDHEQIISPKDGCAPQAACGCCAVDLNGKAVLSCVTPMKKVDGGRVTTTEGLGEFRQQVFARAFVAEGGIQCGFCIPGIVMQANALINREPDPSREQIEQALTPHLCRCTGYKKIVDAIEVAADAIRSEEELPLPESLGRIGDRHPKYDSLGAVLGQRPYVDDVQITGMLHGVLRFSEHPRAKVLQIDTSVAEQVAGVVRILTAADVPGQRSIGLIQQDWPLFVAEGEETRYVGDVLALVVAETALAARLAAEQIQVDYQVLEPLTDPFQALKPEATPIHPGGNELSKTIIRRGDMDAARARTAHVSTGRYETQRIEHGYMEPEAAVAWPADGGVEVLSQSQGVYEDRNQIAKILGLQEDQVRVVLVPNGGGFGGKEDLSVQGHTALAAYLLGRPVKVRLTRDESIRMHPKRHPMWMDYEVGCDADGRLTFVRAYIVGDTGAYASVGAKVLERAAGHATGAYHVPAADIEAVAVYTNNVPCGAMRGFGVNQSAFAVENCIDDLCQQGGFDRWQFRYDNAIDVGRMTATGQVIEGGAGLRATLEAVKEEFYAARYAGLACGIKNTGIGNGMVDDSQVRITVEASDRVIIDHGWTEMGQGVHTVALQALCHETGIDPNAVQVRVDTATGQYAGMTTASRATSLVGNATIDAARKLRRDLETTGGDLEALVGQEYLGAWVVDWTTKPGKEVDQVITHYSYSYATQLVILDDEGYIDRIIAAHDAGKIFNPTLFEGQVEGSLHMGLGYAISEDLPMENGHFKSTRLRQCGILRAKEMPEIEVIGVEVADLYGPYGAKGVGEIGLVPTAGAVANALCQYDGVRRTKLPMRMERRRRKRSG